MTQECLSKLHRSSFAASGDSIRAASEWLAQSGSALGLPSDEVMRLDLCLNEVFANVLSHGGASALLNPVELELTTSTFDGAPAAELLIRDAGVEFDPTQASIQPGPKKLMDAQPGGLGLIMMRSNCDAMTYCRTKDRNELRLSVHWSRES